MKYKKFSDLDSVENLTDEDLFAVSSVKNENAEFESNKVSYGQLKEQLDYDFDVAEVLEVTPPPEDDDTVYVVINGYRVAATRAKEHFGAVYPTNLKRIIPVVSGFRAVKGRLYSIPFTTNNLTLSNLSVKSDTEYFSTLDVFKIDDRSGYINLVTNLNSDGERTSIVTLTDELTGITSSILINHSRIIKGLSNVAASVDKNIITAIWRTEMDVNTGYNYSVLEPVFSLSENIKYRIFFDSDYFNQAYLFKEYRHFLDFKVRVVLEEPFSGNLAISFEDLAQGTGGIAVVNVDYRSKGHDKT